MKKLRPMYFQVEKVEKVKHFSVLTFPDPFGDAMIFRRAGAFSFSLSFSGGILYRGIRVRNFKAGSSEKLTLERKVLVKS